MGRERVERVKRAIVLVSGGMDSAVTLYIAKKEYECRGLIFDYGQRASKEIGFAKKLAQEAGCEYQVLAVPFPWKGSALLDESRAIPEGKVSKAGGIPDTYVPARNIIFLSFAVSCAEAIGAEAVFIGAHQLDFSNYPDCRSVFFENFQKTVQCGTKGGDARRAVRIVTPIIDKTKIEIVELGRELGVPFEYTWSCYKNDELPCGVCESCLFRVEAFEAAGLKDSLNAIRK